MKNTLAKYNEGAYLPSLYLSTVELRCKKNAPCDMALSSDEKSVQPYRAQNNVACLRWSTQMSTQMSSVTLTGISQI